MAMELALEFDVSPHDALLLAVRRRAARVAWVDEVIKLIMREHEEEHGTDAGLPAGIHKWLNESRNEERLMVRSAKAAIDAGVQEAIVRRLELEGRLLMEAVEAGFAVLTQLSVDDRIRFLTAARDSLFALNPADGDGSRDVLPPLDVQILDDPHHHNDDVEPDDDGSPDREDDGD